MTAIRHLVGIAAPPGRILELAGTAAGLAQWWAEDVEEAAAGETALGFFARATVYRLRLVHPPDGERVAWECTSGSEWGGTRLLFAVQQGERQATLRFDHGGWRAETDYFRMCNTTWGALMNRLKRVAEGAPAAPFFRRNGLDL